MIKLERKIYTDKTRKNLYYTILDNKIYFQNHDSNISYVICREKYKILEKSCATHNFTPFMYDGGYYALGGQDSWKHDHKWRGIDYITFKNMFEEHFKKVYKRGEEFYSKIKYQFDTTPVWSHNRGMYLFKSKDGLGWESCYENPVFDVNHEGFISSLEWKSAEFDSRPSIVKYNGKYFIYIRANVSQGMRKIQYTTTKDFVIYDKFRLIKTENEDNEYLINTFVFGRNMYGFIPCYNENESYINLYKSRNGEKFELINRYFHDLPFYVDKGKSKNKYHTCEGVVEKNRDIYFYVHYNYLGYEGNHDVGILEYSISKRELGKL